MEKIEKENINARENTHKPALHDEQKDQIGLETLGVGLNRIETGGEPDDTR